MLNGNHVTRNVVGVGRLISTNNSPTRQRRPGGYSVDHSFSVGIVTTTTPHGGVVNSRFLISQIIADGWYLVRVRGSHHHFKHPTKPGLMTVPHPKKDLLKKTAISILQQALLLPARCPTPPEDEHAVPDCNLHG